MAGIETAGPPPQATVDSGGGGRLMWVLTAPCGCRCGFLAYDLGSRLIADAESAWGEFGYGPVRIARMKAERFAWDLEVSQGQLDDCEHEPYLGSDAMRDIGSGKYRWLTAELTDTIEHLVPCAAADEVELALHSRASLVSAALCGARADGPWSLAHGADPCPACENAAAALTQ